MTPGALARLPIPLFSQKDALHLRLSEFGASAATMVGGTSEDAQGLIAVEHEIDEVVWEVSDS